MGQDPLYKIHPFSWRGVNWNAVIFDKVATFLVERKHFIFFWASSSSKTSELLKNMLIAFCCPPSHPFLSTATTIMSPGHRPLMASAGRFGGHRQVVVSSSFPSSHPLYECGDELWICDMQKFTRSLMQKDSFSVLLHRRITFSKQNMMFGANI